MSTMTGFRLMVSDVKQYVYCARLVYYRYCFPVPRPVTYKMHAGEEQHGHTTDLEERRSLRSYGLSCGERLFGVKLDSSSLGLTGILDMLILTEEEAIPVEYKNTWRKPGHNHMYQLAAYALLAEETFKCSVWRGFFYLIPQRRAVSIDIGVTWKERVRKVTRSMQRMISAEHMPAPTRRRGRCIDCEYRRYCGDVEMAAGIAVA